jgi:hypothetical protein
MGFGEVGGFFTDLSYSFLPSSFSSGSKLYSLLLL